MSDETLDHVYPGVGRLNYFLARVALLLVTLLVLIKFGPDSVVFKIVSLEAMVAGVVFDVMRLRNIGVSEWLMFVRFIPYGGLLLSIALHSAQTGWVESRRLDRAGWAIVGVYAALIAYVIFLIWRGPGMMFLSEFFSNL